MYFCINQFKNTNVLDTIDVWDVVYVTFKLFINPVGTSSFHLNHTGGFVTVRFVIVVFVALRFVVFVVVAFTVVALTVVVFTSPHILASPFVVISFIPVTLSLASTSIPVSWIRSAAVPIDLVSLLPTVVGNDV